MAKFTPGPWELDWRGESLIGSNGDKVKVWGLFVSHSYKTEESIANANLMKASADMYEALWMAANSLMSASYSLKKHGLDGFMATDTIEIANRCNAALAKARGEK